jgi:hypothetical protein
MKRPLLIAMMTASLVGGASSVMAQNVQNVTTPDVAPPANQTIVVTPGGGALYYRQDPIPSYSSDQIQGYEQARSACEARPLLEQPGCVDAVNSRYTFGDTMCGKFSGAALDACLHGADHGG